MTTRAYKIIPDAFDDLRKLLPNGQKSIDGLVRKVAGAKVLKVYLKMGRFSEDEVFEPLLFADISIYGELDQKWVRLEADEI